MKSGMTMRRASRRAGRRAMALLLKLYGRLRLKVNQSEIARRLCSIYFL
jgi:hypothetical protein